MKKLLRLILAMAMILTLAACGGNETPDGTAAASYTYTATYISIQVPVSD